MQIGLIRMISTQKYSKPIINRVQNRTFWALITSLKPNPNNVYKRKFYTPRKMGKKMVKNPNFLASQLCHVVTRRRQRYRDKKAAISRHH